jgi:hypothetical protein
MSSYTTAHYVKLDLATNQILLKSSFGHEFRNGFQNSKLSSMHEVSRRRVFGEEDELVILKAILNLCPKLESILIQLLSQFCEEFDS